MNLMHYLVREEYSMISFEKLFEALTQTDRDVPLKQEKVEEYRKYMDKVSADIKGGVPPVVMHLNHYLTSSK